jgi:hypothetical protein
MTMPVTAGASVLLHALLVMPFVLGASAKRVRLPNAQGAGASAVVSSSDPVLTMISIRDPALSVHSDTLPAEVASRGWTPENQAVTILSPDPTPAFDLSKAVTDQDAAEAVPEAAGDMAGHALMFGRYMGQINARIERAWVRPRDPLAEPKFHCRVQINQDRNGRVGEVVLQQCNGNGHWQASLAQAIQAASPLPAPPDPSVFADAVTLSFDALSYRVGGSAEGFEPELRVAQSSIDLHWTGSKPAQPASQPGVVELRIVGHPATP